MVHKPFQASPIWSSIIANLKMSVKVKRRRFHLKSHNDCFLGSDAVDVVLAHIVQSKFFEGADNSRDKVVRVCQTLLDCKVFETVGAKVFGKDKKQDVFQDNKGYLYRFLNTQMPSMDELEKGVLSPGIQSTFCNASCRWLFVLILFLLFETSQCEILIGCSLFICHCLQMLQARGATLFTWDTSEIQPTVGNCPGKPESESKQSTH